MILAPPLLLFTLVMGVRLMAQYYGLHMMCALSVYYKSYYQAAGIVAFYLLYEILLLIIGAITAYTWTIIVMVLLHHAYLNIIRSKVSRTVFM